MQEAADRKARTKRLIEIGGAVESVLGRPFREDDHLRLMNFLKQQEANGGFFSDTSEITFLPAELLPSHRKGLSHAPAD